MVADITGRVPQICPKFAAHAHCGKSALMVQLSSKVPLGAAKDERSWPAQAFRRRQRSSPVTLLPFRVHLHLRVVSCPPRITPLCDIPSGCCSFTGPWTVTRSSLRMLRRVAAFCRPLWPVLLLVSFPRSRSPVVGVLGLC